MRIDAHQNFWLYEKKSDTWITDEMSLLKRNFLPNDISQTLKDTNFDGIVAVQVSQSHRETEFLLELSQVYKVIKGIVGWVNLCSDDIESSLEYCAQFPIIKGFRHLIESELEGNYLIRDDFQRGIEVLTKYNYTFDLLIRSRHYASTLQCVQNNPRQRFMLNHIAKPILKSQEFEDWALFIEQLSKYPNVYCKISALATEAEWNHWKLDDLDDYFEHIIHSFGYNRICFGSGWPVCLSAGTYEENLTTINKKLSSVDDRIKETFWGGSATSFYGLK